MEAVYDPAGEVLRDTRGGREFRFDPDRRRLMTGRAVYRKLPD
jgi:hypothetical protein